MKRADCPGHERYSSSGFTAPKPDQLLTQFLVGRMFPDLMVIVKCGGVELYIKEMRKGSVNTLVSCSGLSAMLETLCYFTNIEIDRPKVHIVNLDRIVVR